MTFKLPMLFATLALALSAGTALAAPIAPDSTVSITGGILGLPGGKISNATGLDFLNFGVAGTAGGTISLNAPSTGTFGPLFTLAGCPLAASAGGCGTITDLPAGTMPIASNMPISLPITNFYTITQAGRTLSFDLTAITDVSRISAGLTTLSISGSGTFRLAGYDPTPGIFTLTAQGSGETTFSAQAVAGTVPVTVPVPEPASLAILGMGLLGLGIGMARRSPQASAA
ncbi:PEP-CTERM sorting domain-containing protein [Paracraurococcus ruber]|nr:PEP-CTERM sorting domain-containing protein [Paracraurococcus ruber]